MLFETKEIELVKPYRLQGFLLEPGTRLNAVSGVALTLVQRGIAILVEPKRKKPNAAKLDDTKSGGSK